MYKLLLLYNLYCVLTLYYNSEIKNNAANTNRIPDIDIFKSNFPVLKLFLVIL